MLFQIVLWLALGTTAALAVYGLLGRIRDWLAARALAHPNHRTLHVQPTPQGGGLAVVPVALAAIAVAIACGAAALPGGMVHALALAAAALGLLVTGFVDDARELPAGLKLAAQLAAAGLLVLTLPTELRLAPPLVPLVVERFAMLFAVVWFINLVNFMDGMDWMSAVETVGIGGGILVLAALGQVPSALGWCAAALVGAIAGFMPWNASPARLFLGDAGSLPLGLMLAALLIQVAAAGAGAAAFILALYYLADTSITLGRRMLRGARIWQAHREHFYQQALTRGYTVRDVIRRVALTNAGLVVLAVTSAMIDTWPVILTTLASAAVLTGWTLWCFAQGR